MRCNTVQYNAIIIIIIIIIIFEEEAFSPTEVLFTKVLQIKTNVHTLKNIWIKKLEIRKTGCLIMR